MEFVVVVRHSEDEPRSNHHRSCSPLLPWAFGTWRCRSQHCVGQKVHVYISFRQITLVDRNFASLSYCYCCWWWCRCCWSYHQLRLLTWMITVVFGFVLEVLVRTVVAAVAASVAETVVAAAAIGVVVRSYCSSC